MQDLKKKGEEKGENTNLNTGETKGERGLGGRKHDGENHMENESKDCIHISGMAAVPSWLIDR